VALRASPFRQIIRHGCCSAALDASPECSLDGTDEALVHTLEPLAGVAADHLVSRHTTTCASRRNTVRPSPLEPSAKHRLCSVRCRRDCRSSGARRLRSLGRIAPRCRSLVSRRNPRAGLVTLRQTFVLRCHGGNCPGRGSRMSSESVSRRRYSDCGVDSCRSIYSVGQPTMKRPQRPVVGSHKQIFGVNEQIPGRGQSD
jgi:hypothetical protein